MTGDLKEIYNDTEDGEMKMEQEYKPREPQGLPATWIGRRGHGASPEGANAHSLGIDSDI